VFFFLARTAGALQSSAALRAARGAGLERPDAGGEKSCRVAGESADMLCLAGWEVSVCWCKNSGHACYPGCKRSERYSLLPARIGNIVVGGTRMRQAIKSKRVRGRRHATRATACLRHRREPLQIFLLSSHTMHDHAPVRMLPHCILTRERRG
jgi:hypothetical protein